MQSYCYYYSSCYYHCYFKECIDIADYDWWFPLKMGSRMGMLNAAEKTKNTQKKSLCCYCNSNDQMQCYFYYFVVILDLDESGSDSLGKDLSLIEGYIHIAISIAAATADQKYAVTTMTLSSIVQFLLHYLHMRNEVNTLVPIRGLRNETNHLHSLLLHRMFNT